MWASHRRDSNGKNHLYGFVRVERNADDTEANMWNEFIRPPRETYTFHCECSSALVHLRNTAMNAAGLHSTKESKLREGYKTINQYQIETHWPEILEDIEMQLVIRKLQNK